MFIQPLFDNVDVFNHFLTFLSIQEILQFHEMKFGFKHNKYTIHKRYTQYCCDLCKNDNLKIMNEMCNECLTKHDYDKKYEYLSVDTLNDMFKYITKRKLYKHKLLNDNLIRKLIDNSTHLFNRNDIYNFIISNYNSKLEIIIKFHKKTLYYNRIERIHNFRVETIKQHYTEDFIKYMDYNFIYSNIDDNKFMIDLFYSKYVSLKYKLNLKKLKIRRDSQLSSAYIKCELTSQNDDIEFKIVNELEEMDYFHKHTDYSIKLRKLRNARHDFFIPSIRAEIFIKTIKIYNLGIIDFIPDKWTAILENYKSFSSDMSLSEYYIDYSNECIFEIENYIVR